MSHLPWFHRLVQGAHESISRHLLRLRGIPTTLLLTLIPLIGFPIQVQAFPDRPVRIVVPYAPGGFTDILARMIGTKLSERLGQPVIIENKPGASTMLGADLVAKSPADGHTLLMATTSTLSTNPLLFKKMPFKVNDFAPVALAGLTPFVLVAHPAVPVSDLKGLVGESGQTAQSPARLSALA